MAATGKQTASEPISMPRGPGERLKAARVKAGFGLDDVADQMHLSVAIMEAIEENNFDQITAPIFVKGYLRAYARIVHLDENEIIHQYVDFFSNDDPPISSTSNLVPELTLADVRIKWATYLVIVVLATLLAAWWWNKEQNQESLISLDSQSSDIQVATDLQLENPSNVVNVEIEAASQTPTETTVGNVDQEVELAQTVEAQDQDVAIALLANDEELAVSGVAGSAVETADQSASAVNNASETVSEAELLVGVVQSRIEANGRRIVSLAPSGSDQLILVIIEDTWVDIKDAADQQLVYDLLRANQSAQLTGEAPFKVFLGNGHGVEIQFNDEVVDITARIRGNNTARLTIGG